MLSVKNTVSEIREALTSLLSAVYAPNSFAFAFFAL